MATGRNLVIWAGALLVVTGTLGATSQSQDVPRNSAPAAAKTPIDPKTEAVLLRVCGDCHEWQRVAETRRTKAEWGRLMDDMTARGVAGSDDDMSLVLDYVVSHHGLVNVNRASVDDLQAVLGLSESEAQSIVRHRTANGRIPDFDALKKVAGLDPKKLDAIKPAILY